MSKLNTAHAPARIDDFIDGDPREAKTISAPIAPLKPPARGRG